MPRKIIATLAVIAALGMAAVASSPADARGGCHGYGTYGPGGYGRGGVPIRYGWMWHHHSRHRAHLVLLGNESQVQSQVPAVSFG